MIHILNHMIRIFLFYDCINFLITSLIRSDPKTGKYRSIISTKSNFSPKINKAHIYREKKSISIIIVMIIFVM